METFINSFPRYKPNQVLTDTSLNQTSKFLEHHINLSRFALTQTGIIENLHYVVKGGIQISEGFGVTLEGHFIEHNYKRGNVFYEFYKPYQFEKTEEDTQKFLGSLLKNPYEKLSNDDIFDLGKLEFYELLTKEQAEKETNAKSIQDLGNSDYFIVFFKEILEVSQENCSPSSCDTGGSLITERSVPMIVLNSDPNNHFFSKINTSKKLKNFIRLKRFSNLTQIVKTYIETKADERKNNPIGNIICNEYSRVNFQNTDRIISKLQEMRKDWAHPKSMGKEFENEILDPLETAINSLKNIKNTYIPKVLTQDYPCNFGYIAQIDPGSTIPHATPTFYSKTKKPRNFKLFKDQPGIEPNALLYFQSYYGFCQDLELAINELTENYNEYMQKWNTSYEGRIQRFLVLGKSETTINNDYRYHPVNYFSKKEFVDAHYTMTRHFKRLMLLIEKFKSGFLKMNRNDEVKLIPSRSGNVLLEDRAIPYYYDQKDSKLEANWIVTKRKTSSENIRKYSGISNPYSYFVYNINNSDFVRLEGGVLGLTDRFTITGRGSFFTLNKILIEKQINYYNIPIKIEVIEFEKITKADDCIFYEYTGGTKFGSTLVLGLIVVQDKSVVIQFEKY